MEREKEVKLSIFQKFLTTLLFLTALAGQFSLFRISSEFTGLGFLGEPRVWLIVALALFALPIIGYEKNSGKRYRNSSAGSWLALVSLLMVYLCMSALWSKETVYSRELVLSLGILMLLLICTNLLIRNEPYPHIEFFLKAFLLASVVYAVGGMLGFGLWGVRGRLSFFWGGSNAYARIVGAGALIAVYLWAKNRRKLWLLLVPLLVLAVMLSGSRGAIVSFFLAFLLSSFVLVRNIFKWSLLSVILVFSIMYILSSTAGLETTQTLLTRLPTNVENINETYEYSRAPWFSLGVDAYQDAPVFGVGLGGMRGYGISYSHNMILNLAAEGGTMGLLLFALTIIPIIKAWRKKQTTQSDICIILALFYFAASMFSGSYYDQRYIWIFLLFYLYAVKDPSESNIPQD